MEGRYNEISEWLKGLVGQVPKFEICDHTIDILYELMKQNKECDSKRLVVIEEVEAAGRDYGAESSRLDDILNRLTLSIDSLPQAIKDPLVELATTAEFLGLTDPHSARAEVEICDLYTKDEKINVAIKKLESSFSLAQKKNTSLTREVKRLNEIYKSSCKDVKRKHETLNTVESEQLFAKIKAQQYKQGIELCKTELSKLGFKPTLTHEELQKQSDMLKNIEKDLSELRSKLEAYSGFPPEPKIVEEKIVEAKSELVELEDKPARQKPM